MYLKEKFQGRIGWNSKYFRRLNIIKDIKQFTGGIRKGNSKYK